jgi:molybdopterin-guanine dinucleotide biosynthesis adapter protein
MSVPAFTGCAAAMDFRAIHVLGRQNHGKTTLIVDMLAEFNRRGIKVGTIKHSSHSHELDIPGKDSHRHRIAGANPVAIITPDSAAVHWVGTDTETCARILPAFADCELVFVEGHLPLPGPRVEVWRASVGTVPLALEHPDIIALITDDAVPYPLTSWSRQDVSQLADRLLALAE